MKINPISFKPGINLNNIGQRHNIITPFKTDVLLKRKEVSFKGLSELHQKTVDAFSHDLYNLFFDKKDYSLESIQEVVKRFNKDLAVKPLSECKSVLGCAAAFDCRYNIDYEKLEVKSDDMNLYLDDAESRNMNAIIELYTSAIHEFTHALQAIDEDTYSDVLRTSYLRESENKKDALFNIRHCHTRSYKLERIITGPILQMFRREHYEMFDALIAMGLSEEQIIDSAYSNKYANNLDSFVRKSVNELFKDYEEREIPIDKKYNLTYVARQFENEKEACENECKAYEKFSFDLTGQDLCYARLMAKMYSMTAKTLKKMASEC